MKIIDTKLAGLILLEPKIFTDSRGCFFETYHRPKYGEIGVDKNFVQDNLSRSVRGTLRGMHFQIQHPQGKLVQVLQGDVFDVAVDLRSGSPTFGQWEGFYLNDTNHRQLYIPEGFAHGFVALSESVLFHYKCTEIYRPEDEGGLLWNDPAVGINWPISHPIVSAKDLEFESLNALSADALPHVQ
ncbi:MAG: dTDP-4-dehydrorhamnose 3,5-epimerase [Desulfobacterales bacterium]|nr:dTDP-4-dehydrorhamnose 3,5-epimerase [Desulfobacterales bacterium]